MDDDQRFKTAEMRIGGMLDWDKSFSVSPWNDVHACGRSCLLAFVVD